MNNTVKLVLGFLAGALLTCVAIAVLGLVFFSTITRSVLRNVQASPGEAEQIAQEIADFTYPTAIRPQLQAASPTSNWWATTAPTAAATYTCSSSRPPFMSTSSSSSGSFRTRPVILAQRMGGR